MTSTSGICTLRPNVLSPRLKAGIPGVPSVTLRGKHLAIALALALALELALALAFDLVWDWLGIYVWDRREHTLNTCLAACGSPRGPRRTEMCGISE